MPWTIDTSVFLGKPGYELGKASAPAERPGIVLQVLAMAGWDNKAKLTRWRHALLVQFDESARERGRVGHRHLQGNKVHEEEVRIRRRLELAPAVRLRGQCRHHLTNRTNGHEFPLHHDLAPFRGTFQKEDLFAAICQPRGYLGDLGPRGSAPDHGFDDFCAFR